MSLNYVNDYNSSGMKAKVIITTNNNSNGVDISIDIDF